MKKIFALLMCVSSFSQAMIICKNVNTETQKQTIIVLDKGLLMSVCQRDVSPEALALPKKTTLEVCANDMYLRNDTTGITIGQTGVSFLLFSSTKSKVTSTFSMTMTNDSTSATVSVNPAFSAETFEGNNRVEISTGEINMNCETVNKK